MQACPRTLRSRCICYGAEPYGTCPSARLPHANGVTAFTALQYLPVPIIVLSNLKDVVLANEAVGILLDSVHTGVDVPDRETSADTTIDPLVGQPLSQIGVHIVQEAEEARTSLEVEMLGDLSTRRTFS